MNIRILSLLVLLSALPLGIAAWEGEYPRPSQVPGKLPLPDVESPAPVCDKGEPRGMTWVLKKTFGEMCLVGHDKQTNAYRGDMPVSACLPILAIKRQKLPKPPDLVIESHYYSWSGGTVRLTKPVQGFQMKSLERANQIIQEEFGPGWEMASHHDGWGWNFWAFGSIPANQRFWVYIRDQPSNPWNSKGE